MLRAVIKWIAAWRTPADADAVESDDLLAGDDRWSAADRGLAYDAFIRLNVHS